MGGEGPARRADARANRERILEVARDALISSADASLNSIAKQAGVGPGTLYRHFPTRQALVMAVYRHDLHQLVEKAPELLADRLPLKALRAWLDQLAYYGMCKAGLAEALDRAGVHDGLSAESYGPVIGALSSLLRASEEAGSVRAGVDPDDFLLLLGCLWRIDPSTDWRVRADALLDLIMAGLRPDLTEESNPS